MSYIKMEMSPKSGIFSSSSSKPKTRWHSIQPEKLLQNNHLCSREKRSKKKNQPQGSTTREIPKHITAVWAHETVTIATALSNQAGPLTINGALVLACLWHDMLEWHCLSQVAKVTLPQTVLLSSVPVRLHSKYSRTVLTVDTYRLPALCLYVLVVWLTLMS